MAKTSTGKTGFTLLEVFLTIVVMAIAFSGVAAGVSLSRKNLTTARVNRMAIDLADNRLELYKIRGTESDDSITETIKIGNDTFKVETNFELVDGSRSRKGQDLDYEYYRIQIAVDHNYLPSPVVLETFIDYME